MLGGRILTINVITLMYTELVNFFPLQLQCAMRRISGWLMVPVLQVVL